MNIFECTFEELGEELKSRYGKGAWHARALFREIIEHGNIDFHQAKEFLDSPKLLDRFRKDLVIPVPRVVREKKDQDVVKFVSRLDDGLEIESVVIPMKNYNTLCVSTQAGCRMGCRFCETARAGFKRNLSCGEITGQLFSARFLLKKKISNIVFMGMGEPFDNFDAVIKAIRVLNDQRGFDVALRHMTVSTCGLVPGIKKLAGMEMLNLRLAVSLNAPTDESRSHLMPVNRIYPMADLKKALLEYPLKKNGSILIEYILIKGVNDSRENARQLADYLKPLKVRLNVIPYNPGKKSQWTSPTDLEVHRFSDWLEGEGVFVIKRWSRGRSLSAGCGQLAGEG